jgi:hypothetical protein
MTQQLIPNTYRYDSAKSFVSSFTETNVNGNFYYAFAGNHLDYPTTQIPAIYDSVKQTTNDVYRNMIFGKRIQNTDVSLMIRKIEYRIGIVYDMYDDQDENLSVKNFYVSVDAGSYFHIFKCLNNNFGKASTVIPSVNDVGTDGIFYSPIDGYTWKFMYSVDISTYNKFSTDKYIPYVDVPSVINSAVAGEIDAIKIVSAGANYNNYLTGSAYFTVADVNVDANPRIYGLSGAESVGASNHDDFYKGCILLITAGTGAGQYRSIDAYYGTTNPKRVLLDSAFTIQPDNTSYYSIYPGVYLTGDGSQSANAVAWAYVDPIGNTISRIEILNKGADYKTATANVVADVSVGVTSLAEVRPILPPPGGHGANPANELFCSSAVVSVKFSSTESNTIPATSNFKQVGIVKNPMLANVQINYQVSQSRNSFVGAENVYSFYPIRTQANVALSQGGLTLSTTDAYAEFTKIFSPNEIVYITDGTNDQISVVDYVANNTNLVVKSGSLSEFTSDNTTLYKTNIQAYGQVETISAGQISLVNITGNLKTDAILVGSLSGGFVNSVSSFEISNQTKGFDTFVAMYKYIGVFNSSSFANNETVYQGSSSASYHSYISENGSTIMYFTNQNGIFNTSEQVVGELSEAIATFTDKYTPEVVFGTGDIIYLENFDPIYRDNRQTETFKLIFEF